MDNFRAIVRFVASATPIIIRGLAKGWLVVNNVQPRRSHEQSGASYLSQGFDDNVREVPLADWLIL